jgi:hypothetical protein
VRQFPPCSEHDRCDGGSEVTVRQFPPCSEHDRCDGGRKMTLCVLAYLNGISTG